MQVGELAPWDLELEGGQCLMLSGPSGIGKSRILRAIADLDEHGGKAWLEDVRCDELSAPGWRQQVAMMAAEIAWWFDRVGEHFEQVPDTRALQALGFDAAVMQWEVARCSTGEKQRLGLLRLLQNKPRVLLLDEPTASLDPDSVARVEQMIADYLAHYQAAAIWVSHDPQQIRRMDGRHVKIEDNRFVELAL